MKRFLFLTGLLLSTTLTSFAQCEEVDEARVLLIGDSWAFFMNADGTFNEVFDRWGQTNYEFYSNPTLAVNGARTEDFLEEERLTEIQNQLNDKPEIEVVHVSLGGNDFLGSWNVDFTTEETEELSDETFDEIITLVDFIKSVRADIQIVFSGYMYANFAEIINDASPLEESHPFYGNWEEMGFPNFEQLNTLLNDFSDRVFEYSMTDPQIAFVHDPALMQVIYGQEEPLGVDPGGTYPPYFQPLPYGDVTYPSPKVSMRDYGLVRDCFHLSYDAYIQMISYQFLRFYHKFFMDNYMLAEADAKNGTISSDGDLDPVLHLGEVGELENKMVLSFDMSDIPDTVITGASIFLRRDSVTGSNPIGAYVNLVMKSGTLGSSADVDAADFTDEGDIMALACVQGLNDEDENWLRIELPETFLPLISNESQMQFSIAITSSDVNEIFFSNGSNPDYAPVFNLKFKSEFVGLEEYESIAKDNFIVFPNPANAQLNIFTNGENFDRVEVINLQGQTVLLQNQYTNSINIADLVPGQYIIRISSDKGTNIRQFIKQ